MTLLWGFFSFFSNLKSLFVEYKKWELIFFMKSNEEIQIFIGYHDFGSSVLDDQMILQSGWNWVFSSFRVFELSWQTPRILSLSSDLPGCLDQVPTCNQGCVSWPLTLQSSQDARLENRGRLKLSRPPKCGKIAGIGR